MASSRPPTPCATGAATPARGTSYIEPVSPWQNPYVESFGSRLRDELLAVEAFSRLAGAGAGGGLAHRVQHPPTPQRPGLFDPDRLHQRLDRRPPRTLIADWTSSRGPISSVEVPKESVCLDVKRAFPLRVYGRRRPGRMAPSTAVP